MQARVDAVAPLIAEATGFFVPDLVAQVADHAVDRFGGHQDAGLAGGGEGNEHHGGDRGVLAAVGTRVVAPAAERALGAQDHLHGALKGGLDLLVVFDVVGHPPHFRHGEGEEPVLIHAAHVTRGGFLGLLEEKVLGAVERRTVPAEAGKVALHHEGHETERSAGDLEVSIIGGPRAVGILGGEQVLQTALDGEVGGFGEFGRGVT